MTYQELIAANPYNRTTSGNLTSSPCPAASALAAAGYGSPVFTRPSRAEKYMDAAAESAMRAAGAALAVAVVGWLVGKLR